MKTEAKADVIFDIMDVYPHTVKRKTHCWCGKELVKGTEAFEAVMHPNPDGFWPSHKIICSFDCNIVKRDEKRELEI